MILDEFKLDGRAAIVTGARTGIGQAMAVALAEAGADILAVGSTEMDATVAAVEAAGRRCVFHAADLRDGAAARPVAEAALAAFGRLDVLVNNAGIIRRADLPDFREEDWDDVVNLNLRTPFLLSQAAAKAMVAAGRGGRIVNVASVLSFQGGIRVPSYVASKHGIAGVTKTMANELASYGITVNAIAPGYVETDNTAALRADPERSRQILERIPAGRLGQPEDLKGITVFLASDASAYVTGAVLPVDGGWLAR